MMDIKGVHELYQLHSAASSRPAKRGAEETAQAAPAQAGGVDVIQISPEASLRGKVDAAAKSYASEAGSLSAQRLSELRAQYQGDNCPVSGADLAQRLLDRTGGAVQGILLR